MSEAAPANAGAVTWPHPDAAYALVLFELLHRWEDSGELDGLLPGEQTALWALSGRLESILVEPFEGNYSELMDDAQHRLAERRGA